jgi:protein ImuA
LPGIGFPRWQVELLKVRSGKPGSWQLEWVNGKFQPIASTASLLNQEHKQAV